LKDHEVTHAGIKQYICKECGKGFTQKRNLKKHVVTEHTQVKPEKHNKNRNTDSPNAISDQQQDVKNIVEHK
jgi:hypothetical protein